MNEQDIKQALEQIAERDVPEDTNLWPGIQTRIERQRRPHPSRWRIRQASLATVASLMVLALVFLAVPPLRTFAQEVVRQIGSVTVIGINLKDGPHTFTVDDQEVTFHVEPVESITPDDPPMVVFSTDEDEVENGEFELIEIPTDGVLSIAEASERVGFPAYQPANLPDTYAMEVRYVLDMFDAMKAVHTQYASTDDNATLTLSQQQFEEDEARESWIMVMVLEDRPMEDVTVNGNPGLWIEQTAETDATTSSSEQDDHTWVIGTAEMNQNTLLWEQDGYTFTLRGGALTQEEMLEIAASVAP